MPVKPYADKYLQLLGVSANPFARSYLVEEADPFNLFVKQEIDFLLDPLIGEALSKVGSSFVALTGDPGSGRSLRLRVASKVFKDNEAFPMEYPVEPVMMGHDLIKEIILLSYENYKGVGKVLRKTLLGVGELTEEELEEIMASPSSAGRTIIKALASNKPSCLLMDDVHNVLFLEDEWIFYFFEMLREVASNLPDGSLVMLTCNGEAFGEIEKKFPALVSRMHEKLEIPPLADHEAISLVSKRIELFKVRPFSSPLGPLSEEVVIRANKLANGNPARLLSYLEKAVDLAIVLTSDRVDIGIFEKIEERELPLMDFLRSLPEGSRDVVRLIAEKYGGGPVTLNEIALDMEIPVSKAFSKIESLVIYGILRKDPQGKYFLPKEFLVQGKKRKEEVSKEKSEQTLKLEELRRRGIERIRRKFGIR